MPTPHDLFAAVAYLLGTGPEGRPDPAAHHGERVAPAILEDPHGKYVTKVISAHREAAAAFPLTIREQDRRKVQVDFHIATHLGCVDFLKRHLLGGCSGGCDAAANLSFDLRYFLSSERVAAVVEDHDKDNATRSVLREFGWPGAYGTDKSVVWLSHIHPYVRTRERLSVSIESQWYLRNLTPAFLTDITNAMTRYAGARGASPEVAEDVAQIVLRKILTGAITWDPRRRAASRLPDGEPSAFVRFLWDKVKDEMRPKREPITTSLDFDVPDPGPSPEEEMEAHRLQVRAMALHERARLALEHANALEYLNDLEAMVHGLSEREAADWLGKPKTTAHDARAKVLTILRRRRLDLL